MSKAKKYKATFFDGAVIEKPTLRQFAAAWRVVWFSSEGTRDSGTRHEKTAWEATRDIAERQAKRFAMNLQSGAYRINREVVDVVEVA